MGIKIRFIASSPLRNYRKPIAQRQIIIPCLRGILLSPTNLRPTKLQKQINISPPLNPSLIDLVYCFVVEQGKMQVLELVSLQRNCLIEFDSPSHEMLMQSFVVPYSSVLLPHDVISRVRREWT